MGTDGNCEAGLSEGGEGIAKVYTSLEMAAVRDWGPRTPCGGRGGGVTFMIPMTVVYPGQPAYAAG